MVRDFLDNNNRGNVINLGVGLESMNYRIEHANVNFYSIDFESVIDIRRETLGEAPNETLLGSDITGVSWTEKLDTSKPTLLIASGVFQYFKKVDVLELIRKLKSVFDNAELIFDATNEVGIRYAQRYVKKTGNMAAMMYFYINDADAFAEEAEVELIEVRGFFNEARAMLGRRLKLFKRIAMKVADDKKRTLILRVGLYSG